MTQSTSATCTTSHCGESSSLLGKMRLPSILKPVAWPYAAGSDQDSVGKFIGTVQFNRFVFPVRLSCWEATGPARREFANRLGVEIAEYLDCNSDLCDSGSIFHMSLYMVGASASRAKPTVMFVSADAKVRKDAFKIIKQSEILTSYPGFALAHIPLEAEYKDLRQLGGVEAGASINLSTRAGTSLDATRIITPENNTNNGRRLYFINDIKGTEQRRAATAGGIVSFRAKPMFLTVCHAASQANESEPEIRTNQDSGASDECEIIGFGDLDIGSQESEDGAFVETTSRGSMTPGSSHSSQEENSSLYSSTTESMEARDLRSTSPTQRPVNPHTTALATVSAGEIVLSDSEWDCVLVRPSPTLLTDSRVEQATCWNEEGWIPLEDYSAHVEPEARDAAITTITLDAGRLEGRLSGTPSFVRLPFSKSFKQVYIARFDRPLAPGDCGSWVSDAKTGKLFGHVIAGSATTGLATIMPAHRLFAHLACEMRAKVSEKSPATTTPNIKTETRKRRASGALQGLWSSFKKSTRGKGPSYDAKEGPELTKTGDEPTRQTDDLAAETLQVRPRSPSLHPVPAAPRHNDPSVDPLFPDGALGSEYPEIPPHVSDWWQPPFLNSDNGSKGEVVSISVTASSSISCPLSQIDQLGPIPEWAVPGHQGIGSGHYSYPRFNEDPFNVLGYSFVDLGLEHSYSAFSTSGPLAAEEMSPAWLSASVGESRAKSFRAYHQFSPFPSPPTVSYPSSCSRDTTLQSSIGPPPGEGLEKDQVFDVQSSVDSGELHTENKNRQCPHPDCGKWFTDLRAHMLTHQMERWEKCPIETCQYHVQGFARKYDKNRHMLTHHKGTMVCGFCPGSGSPAEKSFNRADVFKRHLTAVHSVEQVPPNSREKTASTSSSRKALSRYAPDATGKCSTCSKIFEDAQEFYEHLDECVLDVVRREVEDLSEATKARPLAEVEKERDAGNILDKNSLPIATTGGAQATDEEDDEEMDGDPDGHTGSQIKMPRGLTHSRGGVPLPTKIGGRKNRRDYPASWGFDKGNKSMKKRVMAVFDRRRRLAKDDLMLSTENEARITFPGPEHYITDRNMQTLWRGEGFVSAATDDEPWISGEPTEQELKKMLEDSAGHQPAPGLFDDSTKKDDRLMAQMNTADHDVAMKDEEDMEQ